MSYKNMFEGLFGIEKENIRINQDARISKKAHDNIFGENNPYIIRDFSESQIEMITSPHKSVLDAYNELHNINHIVISTLKDELLWPQSNPPIIKSEDEILIANYETHNKKEYREYLSNKYGKKRAVISGIHFNISLSNKYIEELFKNSNKLNSFTDFKNDLYLKITKYFLKDKYIFTKLFSASPIFHNTYNTKCVTNSKETKDGDCYNDKLISLRNSACGYKNFKPVHLNYESLNEYECSIKRVIEEQEIISESEIYNPVRIKRDDQNNISYLELRFIDINPLFFTGVSINDLKLIHLLFIYYSTLDNFIYDKDMQIISELNNNTINHIVNDGKYNNDIKELNKNATKLLNNLKSFLNEIDNVPYNYKEIIDEALTRLLNNSYSDIIKTNILKSNYINYHLEIANNHKNYVINNPLNLLGLDNLELSTKILITSAIKKGYKYEVLDEFENFIKLTSLNGQVEYIKQATKTSLDNYSSVLLIENKALTKRILNEGNLRVPFGYVVTNKLDTISIYDEIKTIKSIVVKPNNTNFGLGISILIDGYTKDDYIKAVDYAFNYDKTILIEEYINGLEYRFLVIGNKVEGVLHRRSANVLGNGVNTISELIKLKNQHPYRSKGYKTPLELIEVDQIVLDYLDKQGKSLSYIPKENELIYLRENSNISTGGDSIDVTDLVHPSYFDKVLDACKLLNINISGVDVLISDIKKPVSDNNYAIIELNFNPAIHIHCFPLEGSKRPIGDKIIDTLFNKN